MILGSDRKIDIILDYGWSLRIIRGSVVSVSVIMDVDWL